MGFGDIFWTFDIEVGLSFGVHFERLKTVENVVFQIGMCWVSTEPVVQV